MEKVIGDAEPLATYREVRFQATGSFVQVLEWLQCSLLVSTYQAGKVLCLGTHQGELKLSFLSFDRAMGLAVSPQQIAIGTRRQIHFLQASHEIARRVEPAGEHDGCWAMRRSFYTGNIHGHDLAWGKEGLWIANTLFSTLCTLQDAYNFVPRWRPKFVSQLIDQDRCHLNGLAMDEGEPAYVTVLAESDEPAGWRPTKATSGCVIDVKSDEVILRGLSMPHSPRVYQRKLYALDSGRGGLISIDRETGQAETIEQVPGYTRGLAFNGQFAFVGLSKIRETNIFGGLPISAHPESLRCGIAVIDLHSGKTVATFQFHSGVEEIFAVEVIHAQRNPALFGPSQDHDEQSDEVWIVPPPSVSRN